MAQEKWNNSPPQNLIIVACALGSVALLFVLKFGFDSYYYGARDRAVEAMQGEYSDLRDIQEAQAEWQRQLESGRPVPIDDAMSRLASAGRDGIPQIEPRRGDERNDGPLEGWNQLSLEAPPPVAEPAAAEAAGGTPGVAPPGAEGVSNEAMQQLQEAIRRAIEARQQGGAAPGGAAPGGAQ